MASSRPTGPARRPRWSQSAAISTRAPKSRAISRRATPTRKMDNIYFDLDGTLTDPKPGITRSIQYALKKLDREVPSEDEVTWCIGPPLRASFAKLLGDDSLADRGLALYRERFADVRLYENAVYPD